MKYCEIREETIHGLKVRAAKTRTWIATHVRKVSNGLLYYIYHNFTDSGHREMVTMISLLRPVSKVGRARAPFVNSDLSS